MEVYVKDVLYALRGSPRFMSQMPVTMIEHDEVLEPFPVFEKRKVEIASSHGRGAAADI